MKKLTYIACLFASASFGMNDSMNQNINSSFELFDSFEQNAQFAEAPNVLPTSLSMSIDDFDNNVVLRSSIEAPQNQEYAGYQQHLFNMNYAVANDSNGDVATMALRQDPEMNAQYGYALLGEYVWNNQPNMQQSYSMSEDDISYVDESSLTSDEVDFWNLSSSTSSFEYM